MNTEIRQAMAETNCTLEHLVTRHPRLFRGARPLCWSYLHPGWLARADRLCADIEALLSDDAAQLFSVQQIKEKFGTLRFYWRLAKSGDDRCRTRATPAEGRSLEDLIESLVEQAWRDSASICDICGMLGRIWSDVAAAEHLDRGVARPDDLFDFWKLRCWCVGHARAVAAIERSQS